MIRTACFAPTHENWERPTPDEVRAYLNEHDLTTYRVRKMLGVGNNTPGRWLTGEIQISFCHWSALVRAVESQKN